MAKLLVLQPSIWLACLLLLTQTLLSLPQCTRALPHDSRPDEIVTVEAVQCPGGATTDASEHNATTTTTTKTTKTTATASGEDSSSDSNESDGRNASDDLIFLTKKPQQQQQQQQYNKQQQQQQQHHHQQAQEAHIEANKQRIDLFSSASTADDDDDDGDDDDDAGAAAAAADADDDNNDDNDDENENDGHHVHENDALAHAEADADAEAEAEAAANVKPIDMSDFLALIPADEVKSIGANYYRNDPEVQRAYAFLTSRHFAEVRAHILQLPEMKAFLRHLNNGGLNLLNFLQTVINMTRNSSDLNSSADQMPMATTPTTATTAATKTANTTTEPNVGNEIENRLSATTSRPYELQAATTTTTIPIQTEITTIITTATTKAPLNGLHGLVDSILILMPQDEVLTTFFDKLETDEQFSKLVDSIGTPKFAKIVGKMQNSAPLRSFIYTLHSNGIYIARIVDSLKSYFFLGTL